MRQKGHTMKMEKILANEGIELRKDFGTRKVMQFRSYDEKSIVGVEINPDTLEIGIHLLKGNCPYVDNLFTALLADKDVRKLILEYQEKGRAKSYKMWHTSGMSGRTDYFITIGNRVAGFTVPDTKHLLHVSCAGKLNEGFGDRESKMYIGDFVELVAYMGWNIQWISPKKLKKKSGVKYIRPHYVEETWGGKYREDVTKLL